MSFGCMGKISHVVNLSVHYNDVIMSACRLKSPASQLFTQPIIQKQIKENIKAPHHWPLWGEFTSDRWIPRTKGQLRGKCFHLMTLSWCSSVETNSSIAIKTDVLKIRIYYFFMPIEIYDDFVCDQI